MAEEVKKLLNDKVSDAELNRAKTQIKASLLMSLESSSSTAEILARQLLLFNRIIPISETVEKIEAITKDDLQRISQNIFTTNPTYTILGCNGMKYPDYDYIKSLL